MVKCARPTPIFSSSRRYFGVFRQRFELAGTRGAFLCTEHRAGTKGCLRANEPNSSLLFAATGVDLLASRSVGPALSAPHLLLASNRLGLTCTQRSTRRTRLLHPLQRLDPLPSSPPPAHRPLESRHSPSPYAKPPSSSTALPTSHSHHTHGQPQLAPRAPSPLPLSSPCRNFRSFANVVPRPKLRWRAGHPSPLIKTRQQALDLVGPVVWSGRFKRVDSVFVRWKARQPPPRTAGSRRLRFVCSPRPSLL